MSKLDELLTEAAGLHNRWMIKWDDRDEMVAIVEDLIRRAYVAGAADPVTDHDTAAAHRALAELVCARTKFPDFHSPHEGWAVLHEEMCELWDAVKRHDHVRERMCAEAIQVAAMALRFVVDCAGGERP